MILIGKQLVESGRAAWTGGKPVGVKGDWSKGRVNCQNRSGGVPVIAEAVKNDPWEEVRDREGLSLWRNFHKDEQG
jgi:hypothetical protein